MISDKSIGLDLVSEIDFESYLDGAKGRLPEKFKTHPIKSVVDISGNINRVKRVTFDNDTTLIVKHAPAGGKLARYPKISFSENRLDYEYRWFTLARKAKKPSTQSSGAQSIPEIYHFDKENRLLLMEDLGIQSLNNWLNSPGGNGNEILTLIVRDLKAIHDHSKEVAPVENPAAAQNRPFIFTVHLEKPDLVKELWLEGTNKHNKEIIEEKLAIRDSFLNSKAKEIKPYLVQLQTRFKQCDNPVFTHGDLHTESIIVKDERHAGFIDAELSDYGDPAFDLGFICAHLIANEYVKNANPTLIENLIKHIHETYTGYRGSESQKKNRLPLDSVRGYAGAEILRRLIGPAGFNIALDMRQFNGLLDLAMNLITERETAFK